MKSIKKRNNSFWMIGSFLIILLLFLILLSKSTPQDTKETIDFYEVTALMKALDDADMDNTYDILLSKYVQDIETDGMEEENETEVLETTYKMLKEILDTYDKTGSVSKDMLPNKPDKDLVSPDDFYILYENLMAQKRMEDEVSVSLETVEILSVREGLSENGEAILITEKESGECDHRLFETYAGYVVNAYVKRSAEGVSFIAVKEIVEDKIQIPYLYVAGQNEEGMHFFINGMEAVLPYTETVEIANDTIATISIEKGKIVKAESFDEKINDKVLAVNETSVTLDNKGVYEFEDEMKIYKVFEGVKEGTISDVALGYKFVDFVLKDGKICACLIVADDEMEYIRVLIKNTDFLSNYHEKVTFLGDCAYKIYKNGEEYKACDKNEPITFSMQDLNMSDVIKVVPDILSGKIEVSSLNRSQGIPSYGGIMELRKREEGLVLVNEILLEEYLYTVVPSEMPAYYHNEALMAQAVCARTYAYTKMKNAGLKDLGAHLDDSTAFQVYNNIDEQVTTTNAVRNTKGMIVSMNGEPFETMYYSTSCGLGSEGQRINKTESIKLDLSTNAEFDSYIETINDTDFEANEGMYRWTYETEIDTELLEKRIKECYNKNKKNVLYLDAGSFEVKEEFLSLGTCKDIYVAVRSEGGRAESLIIEGSEETIMICGEYHIRYALLNEEKNVSKQDKSQIAMSTLLPSAFFKISPLKKNDVVVGYSIVGGGFGHGIGMSQNGAGNMAMEGYTYSDILTRFYENCTLEQVY